MKPVNDKKKYRIFMILTMATGIIYKLPYIQDVFYVPMQKGFNLTHVQIGNILSIAGLISVLGFLGSICFVDSISKKVLIPCGLIGVGIAGIYLSTFPTYNKIIFVWVLFAIFSDMIYWPVLVKSIKNLGSEGGQGRIFGCFEAGRGVFDTIIVFIALYLFAKTASLKYVILFYSITSIIIGGISFFILEKDSSIKLENKSKSKMVLEAIKLREVWLVSGNIFCTYMIYCGLTYMMPFLQNNFEISIFSIGVYGMINQYVIKIFVGPLAGYIADKKLKSTPKYFTVSFLLVIFILMLMIILSSKDISSGGAFILVMIFSIIVNSMKVLLFAPMEEVGINKEMSSVAISLASFIGYLPLVFCFSLYGAILDNFEGINGYRILFGFIILFSVLGVLISKKLVKISKLTVENREKLSS